MTGRVVTLDLRDADGTAEAHIEDLFTAEPDLTRLLVLDDAAAINRHRAAFETLLTARRVDRLLCVVVGRQPGRDDLLLPANLQKATLWVPDPSGVDWRHSAAAAAKGHPADAPGTGLGRLIEVVQVPEVFERTADLVDTIPYGAACPALKLADVPGADQDGFLVALHTAAHQLLQPSDSVLPPVGDTLAGRAGGAGSAKLIPGRPLDTAMRGARHSLEEAKELADTLAEGHSLFSRPPSVTDAMIVAAERLRRLHATLIELLATVALADDPQQEIAAQGLQLPADDTFAITEIETTLERSARSWLHTPGVSLPQIQESLRAWSKALGDTGDQRRALDQVLSDRILDLLRTPVPFPAPQTWMPVAGAIVSALAGLSPIGPIGGGLMAVVWTLLVVQTVVRGPNCRLGDHTGRIAANLGGALLGGVAGGLAGFAGLPTLVWLPAVLAAVLAAPVLAVMSWKDRVRAWLLSAGIDVVIRALDEVCSWLDRLSASWADLNARAVTRDALSRFQASVSGAEKAVKAEAAVLDRELGGGGRNRPSSGYLSIVQNQFGDLLDRALEPSLRKLDDQDLATHSQDTNRRTGRLLGEWKEHVRVHGPVEPPPFAADQDTSPPPDTGEDLSAQTRAAAYDPAGEMWQLCAATDLALLRIVPDPPAVRFAPRAGRPAFRATVPPDTVWVPANAHAGVLRLVSLRPHTIVWSWTDTGLADENGVEL